MQLLSGQITIITTITHISRLPAHCFPSLANDHPPSLRHKRTQQTVIRLGRFRYNSVGKEKMKHDELLMFFPNPGFQEHESKAVIVQEKPLSSPSTKRQGKVIQCQATCIHLPRRLQRLKSKNRLNSEKPWRFLCSLLWRHLTISLFTTSHWRRRVWSVGESQAYQTVPC